MKRFEYTQTFEEYAYYDSTRESDEIQRVTLVYPALKDKPPYAYLSMKDGAAAQISYEWGVGLLREEVK